MFGSAISGYATDVHLSIHSEIVLISLMLSALSVQLAEDVGIKTVDSAYV